MPTFKEIQAEILAYQNRKEILNHLIDHLEDNFRPNGGHSKNFLLKEDKTSVPDAAFELVVKEMLDEVEAIDTHLDEIMNLQVTTKEVSDVKKV